MVGLCPDILLGIIALCSPRDISSLMQTCRFLYEESPKILLRETVPLKTSIQLSGFLTFLRAQEGRLAFVRSLRFELLDWEDEGVPEFFIHLPLMLNLHSLHLTHGERLFQRDPDVVDIIAEIPSLQELTVHHAGFETTRLLKCLQSHLVCVDIDFGDLDDYPFFQTIREEQYPPFHPLLILSHSMASLTKLVLRQWYTHSEITPDPDLLYPNMRELEIHNSGLPLIAPFVRACPNLWHLVHRAGLESRGHPLSTTETSSLLEGYAAHRAHNISQQASFDRTWDQLHSFSGDLAGLYVLGLTCPIERVTLHLNCEDWPAMLGPSLFYARPRYLEIRDLEGRSSTNGDASGWRESLRALLSGEVGSRMEQFSGMSDILAEDQPATESILL
ncbi:hypothetical protein C8Q70DRAFT_1055302 [Cubamyces menziesii]|nr:hypothetical protein C8Q70DRAFT_1055302 [Cubamyces menziesii]